MAGKLPGRTYADKLIAKALALGAGGGTLLTATGADLNKLAGAATGGAPVRAFSTLITQKNNKTTYTVTHPIPAGSYIVDVQVHGIALWDGTSASLKAGDGADDDGFFLATNLKATDLLAGEANTIEHPGGLAGAYIASEQRVLYGSAARSVIYVVTQSGTGTLGRTRVVTLYVTPADTAVVEA